MELKYTKLPPFAVIGMEGSTDDGADFVRALWDKANAHFSEIAPLAMRDERGMPLLWGLMSDKARTFRPWEKDFSEGLYLAGIEVDCAAQPPAGWTKWTPPAQEYAVAPAGGADSFREALSLLAAQNVSLAGAVYDKIDPMTGETFLYFPIRRFEE